jgi:hypothetical protein
MNLYLKHNPLRDHLISARRYKFITSVVLIIFNNAVTKFDHHLVANFLYLITTSQQTI